MTLPVPGTTVPAGVVPRSNADMGDVVRRLEARIAELERRTLYSADLSSGNMNIRGGSVNIYDNSDALVAVVGLLPNGDRGVGVVDPSTSALVTLSTLAFGIRSVNTDAEVVLGTEGIWATLTGGPTVSNVPIGSSGRALVLISADISCAPTGSNTEVEGWMGFEITGATAVPPDVVRSLRVAFRRDADTAGNPGVTTGATRVVLVEGLTAGLHTVEARYRISEDTPADEASFMSRNITVMPF